MPNKILTIGSTLNPVDTAVTGILTAPTPTSSSENTQVATKEYVDNLTIISSTDNAVARFDGTNGLLQNSGVLISDDNLITCPGRINFANGTRYYVTSTGDASFKNLGLGSFERDSGSSYILKLGGNTLVNGTIYLANGTTYGINNSAIATLNQTLVYNVTGRIHSTQNSVDNVLIRSDTRAGTSSIGTGTITDTTIAQTDWGEMRFRVPALRKTYATAGDTSSSYTSSVFAPHYWWRVYSANSTTGARLGYYENYSLPGCTLDRTTNASYSILTSKNAVTIAQGGTGKTSWTANGLVYASSASALGQLGVGTSGYVLQSNGNAAPSWINATNSNTASTIVKRDASGNFSAGTITATLSGTATTANALNFQHTNELFLGNANSQNRIWFNYRRVPGGATSGNTAITEYHFGNGNAARTGVTIYGGTFNGSFKGSLETNNGGSIKIYDSSGTQVALLNASGISGYNSSGQFSGLLAWTNINSVTAGTAGTSSATSGATLEVPYVTYNSNGFITGTGTHTHTINSLAASAISSGTLAIGRIPTSNSQSNSTATVPTSALVYGMNTRLTTLEGGGTWTNYSFSNNSASGLTCAYNATAKLARLSSFTFSISSHTTGATVARAIIPPLNELSIPCDTGTLVLKTDGTLYWSYGISYSVNKTYTVSTTVNYGYTSTT